MQAKVRNEKEKCSYTTGHKANWRIHEKTSTFHSLDSLQFKLSKYSNGETPDSCNLLRCLDVDNQDGFQVWDQPNDELKQRSLWFGLVSFILLMQTWQHTAYQNELSTTPKTSSNSHSLLFLHLWLRRFLLTSRSLCSFIVWWDTSKSYSSTAMSLPLFPGTPLSPHKPRCICGKQQSPKPWGYILHPLGASYRTSDFTLCTSASSPVPDSQGFCDIWLWTWLTST